MIGVPASAARRRPAVTRQRAYVALFLVAVAVIMPAGCAVSEPKRPKGRIWADQMVVEKSKRRLILIQDGEVLREYRIRLGERPRGHKVREGDERTPEGNYFLDWRNSNSRFYKSIHISYPNELDIRIARRRGYGPGGMIMIHGQPNDIRSDKFKKRYLSRDWTNGCIAVQNHEMDEILRLVRYGTPIKIRP